MSSECRCLNCLENGRTGKKAGIAQLTDNIKSNKD